MTWEAVVVVVEAVAQLVNLAVKNLGEPTAEVRARLIKCNQLLVPGPCDDVLAEIDRTVELAGKDVKP